MGHEGKKNKNKKHHLSTHKVYYLFIKHPPRRGAGRPVGAGLAPQLALALWGGRSWSEALGTAAGSKGWRGAVIWHGPGIEEDDVLGGEVAQRCGR